MALCHTQVRVTMIINSRVPGFAKMYLMLFVIVEGKNIISHTIGTDGEGTFEAC